MKNILLILTDNQLKKQLKNTLRSSLIHVITANNQQEELHLIQEQYPDLIITDLNPLKISEYQRIKRIKEVSFLENIPLILLNKHDNLANYFKVWQLGINLYFSPSRDLDNLNKMIISLLDQKSLQISSNYE